MLSCVPVIAVKAALLNSANLSATGDWCIQGFSSLVNIPREPGHLGSRMRGPPPGNLHTSEIETSSKHNILSYVCSFTSPRCPEVGSLVGMSNYFKF
ncbi:hypothetical protein FKM82_022879 [Ascaphus truei]